MIQLARKKSLIQQLTEAVGRKPKSSGPMTVRSGLISVGSVVGLAALSAVVSAIRERREYQDVRG